MIRRRLGRDLLHYHRVPCVHSPKLDGCTVRFNTAPSSRIDARWSASGDAELFQIRMRIYIMEFSKRKNVALVTFKFSVNVIKWPKKPCRPDSYKLLFDLLRIYPQSHKQILSLKLRWLKCTIAMTLLSVNIKFSLHVMLLYCHVSIFLILGNSFPSMSFRAVLVGAGGRARMCARH